MLFQTAGAHRQILCWRAFPHSVESYCIKGHLKQVSEFYSKNLYGQFPSEAWLNKVWDSLGNEFTTVQKPISTLDPGFICASFSFSPSYPYPALHQQSATTTTPPLPAAHLHHKALISASPLPYLFCFALCKMPSCSPSRYLTSDVGALPSALVIGFPALCFTLLVSTLLLAIHFS